MLNNVNNNNTVTGHTLPNYVMCPNKPERVRAFLFSAAQNTKIPMSYMHLGIRM